MELRKFIATTIREYLNENVNNNNNNKEFISFLKNNFIEVERFTRYGRYGEFFAPKGEGYDGYGDKYVEAFIPKNTNIEVINSSEYFLKQKKIQVPFNYKSKLKKNNWSEIFYSMYTEDIDDDVPKELKSIEKYTDFIYRIAQSIKLYRIIDNDVINEKCLGRCWTYSRDYIKTSEFQNNVGFEKNKSWFIIEAIFNKNDIEPNETLEMLVRNVGEREIRLKSNCIKPIEYKIYKYIDFV